MSIAKKINSYINEKEIIKEDRKLDIIISDIESETDDNNHTGSIRILAKDILNDKKMIDALDAIETIHMYFGHLPKGLDDVRTEIRNMALGYAKKKMSKEDFDRLQGAF